LVLLYTPCFAYLVSSKLQNILLNWRQKMAGKNKENSKKKFEEEIASLLFYLQISPDDADCWRLFEQKLRRFYNRQQRRDNPS
jgi:hypothetical protein